VADVVGDRCGGPQGDARGGGPRIGPIVVDRISGVITATMRLLLPALLLALAPVTAGDARADTLTVVTLNLWHDQQDWPRRRAMILDELRTLGPDVICLQEVLQHATLRNQAHDLADSLGYGVTFASVDPDTGVKRYGNAILARHPALETGWKPLEPKNDYRVVAHMRIDYRGWELDVFCTHLHHTAEGAAIRAEQVRDLLDFVKARRGKGATVLAGDFNASPRAPELREVMKRHLDVFAALHRGAGRDTVTTLNPAKGHAPRRIDYVFVSRDGRPRLEPLSSEIVFDEPAADGTWPSDHFGVVAKFRVGR
jgi:endonuclease/exonuclease/phosphatase family metal-dependent hydrolase